MHSNNNALIGIMLTACRETDNSIGYLKDTYHSPLLLVPQRSLELLPLALQRWFCNHVDSNTYDHPQLARNRDCDVNRAPACLT